LVDIEPSMSSRSKLTRTAARSASSSTSASSAASVVRTVSIVAIDGAIMPAPLVMPPMRHPAGSVCATVFGTVSVVMIARAAAPPAGSSDPSAACAAPTPPSTFSFGSCSPMRPVEHTATSIAPQPIKPAAASAVACAVWKPWWPVQALAPPELRTTARSLPVASTCSDQRTGAALTLLRVNTPAAVELGPSLTTSARSRVRLVLSPAATPAARKPSGCVTVMGQLR
jgi:hypothetical protein